MESLYALMSRCYTTLRTYIVIVGIALTVCALTFFVYSGLAHAMVLHLLDSSRYMALAGIVSILLVAAIASRERAMINWRLVANALLLQGVLAFFILRTNAGHALFEMIAQGFTALYGFANHGVQFVFGNLGVANGPAGVVFGLQILPIIIFFGALTALLFHLGIIQLLVRGVAFVVQPLLGTSGAETLCAAANSMLGQTEAPLLIKNYLPTMTESEILVVMVSGMGTISGSLLAIYGSIGVPMQHLLAASVMAVPGALLIAKMLLPETEVSQTGRDASVKIKSETKNILDAISGGTVDGMYLALNVGAMLITFISLIALINYVLHDVCGFYSLNQLFSMIFAPCAQLLGIASSDAAVAGELLGTKLAVNEFVAFSNMTSAGLSERSRAILTYALCGFSNFSCIGIQIGGIGALAPQKRELLTRLGMRALLGGTLANFLNAAIAALLI